MTPFRGRALPVVRVAALGALLLAEVVLLSIRFDMAPLVHETDGWAVCLRQAPWVVRLGLAVGTALLLFVGLRCREVSPELWATPRRLPVYLAAHLLSLGGFTWLTALILEGDVRIGGRAELWAIAWFAAGVATVGCWAAAVVAPGHWPALLRHGWGAGLAATVFAAAIWGVAQYAVELWQHLGGATLRLTALLLGLFFPDTVCRPEASVVGTSTFAVTVAPACSGYEGIALILMFLTVYLWLFRRELRFPQALLLLPLGAVVIWLANSVRIALLVAVGTRLSREVALGGFHSQAGWLAFNAVAVGLVVVSQRTRLFYRSPPLAAEEQPVNRTAAYLMPLLALLAAQMLTAALTQGFDALMPLRALAVAAVLWHYRSAYAELRGSWAWPAAAVGVLAFVVWMLLEPLSPHSAPSRLPEYLAELPPAWALAWLVVRVTHSVLLVPVAEELAFRGYLPRRLLATDFKTVLPGRFTAFTLLASSLLFGLLHGRWLAGTLCGVLFALALRRRGRLCDAVLAHAVANALIAAWVLLGEAWYLWE